MSDLINRLLKRGVKGADVKKTQEQVNTSVHLDQVLTINGVYDQPTEDTDREIYGVPRSQRRHKLARHRPTSE